MVLASKTQHMNNEKETLPVPEKPEFQAYNEYVKLALVTECDYELPRNRLLLDTQLLTTLRVLFAGSAALGQQQDILKRVIMYGETGRTFTSVHVDLSHAHIYANPPVDLEKVQERLKSPQIMRLLHAVIGAQTEASELQSHLADVLFAGAELDVPNVVEETGDSQWYHALALAAVKDLNGAEPVDALQRNIWKLQKRFGKKFSEFYAKNRNLTEERKTLETLPTEPSNVPGGVVDAPPKTENYAPVPLQALTAAPARGQTSGVETLDEGPEHTDIPADPDAGYGQDEVTGTDRKLADSTPGAD